jgi:hypothetical protein
MAGSVISVMPPTDDERRAAARERQARWRARVKAEEAVYPVTAKGRILNMLRYYQWLAEADADDPAKVADAMTRLMDDIAKDIP